MCWNQRLVLIYWRTEGPKQTATLKSIMGEIQKSSKISPKEQKGRHWSWQPHLPGPCYQDFHWALLMRLQNALYDVTRMRRRGYIKHYDTSLKVMSWQRCVLAMSEPWTARLQGLPEPRKDRREEGTNCLWHWYSKNKTLHSLLPPEGSLV